MIKSNNLKYFLLSLAAVFILNAGTQVSAEGMFPITDNKNNSFYFNEEPIANKDLDEMRGGFIARNGVIIDFTFSASTIVDGQLINQVVLDTTNLSASAGSLRNIIQVGEGNKVSNGVDINTLPNVLTIVQNNLDNLTIEQVNMLDLTVQNVDNFINQSITPEINFQIAR